MFSTSCSSLLQWSILLYIPCLILESWRHSKFLQKSCWKVEVKESEKRLFEGVIQILLHRWLMLGQDADYFAFISVALFGCLHLTHHLQFLHPEAIKKCDSIHFSCQKLCQAASLLYPHARWLMVSCPTIISRDSTKPLSTPCLKHQH